MASFTCPVDGTVLVPVERSGIEIDHCPSCRGVWLDRGELDKILERNAASAPAPAPQPQQYRDERPRYDDRGHGHPHKKRRSFLEDLFD
ncbi:zf-TFIIB domain-containing protein [Sphingomonas sp. R-74633]|uniref:TFIIB-type zinc ribbon-containing protein n=1 Tax=Sphingomonas sp. R-74633 TaxID=2751188 RepID=UPI0015D16C96|nr:zf-TFIIB domain-containing protein [Sphingomonas sp. R-74633]NYT40216.1 zf-TFIIB domain-containing protein [Sphingomonas sp. R-74633]